jgi:hypothetical protein
MPPEGRTIHRPDDGVKTALSFGLGNLTYGVPVHKELDLRQCRRTTFDIARLGRARQHAILKYGSGRCYFAVRGGGSVRGAGLCGDAHSLRYRRAYNRTHHRARFKHLPQLSLVTFGYEPATTCRSKRKAKRPR